LQALLRWAGMQQTAEAFDYNAIREGEIERLADTLEAHLDMQKLDELIGGLIRQAEQGPEQVLLQNSEKQAEQQA
jgi:tRNA threonylcarbamoyladenosine modification (KEOPS) complex Cgi121 subunit